MFTLLLIKYTYIYNYSLYLNAVSLSHSIDCVLNANLLSFIPLIHKLSVIINLKRKILKIIICKPC